MYTAFLADDEFVVIKGLLKSIDWEGLQTEVLGYAEDGCEALEKISRLQPDIVLIDIRMPRKNGLEVMRRITQEYDCAFIIFSGYAEFDYAKEALQMNAIDYLIKPVDVPEIEMSIKKAQQFVDKCKNSRNSEYTIKQDWLLSVLNGMMPVNSVFADKEYFEMISVRFDSDKLSVVDQSSFSSVWTYNNMGSESITLRRGNERLSLIASSTVQHAQMADDYIVSMLGEKVNEYPVAFYWGKGSIVSRIEDIEKSYLEATDAVEICEFFGEQRAHDEETDNEQPDNKQPEEEDLVEYTAQRIMKAMTREEAEGILSWFFERITSKGYSMDYIKSISVELYFRLKHSYQEENPDIFKKSLLHRESLVYHNKDLLRLDRIKKKLLLLVEKANTVLKDDGTFYTQKIIKACKLYIEEHLDEQITLGEVASSVHMNATYLSHFFKTKTGSTLFEYITERRIQKAEVLLKTSNLKIYEVAKKVGYPDQKYFCQVFKKKTGKTAAEYRNLET